MDDGSTQVFNGTGSSTTLPGPAKGGIVSIEKQSIRKSIIHVDDLEMRSRRYSLVRKGGVICDPHNLSKENRKTVPRIHKTDRRSVDRFRRARTDVRQRAAYALMLKSMKRFTRHYPDDHGSP
jgi:hypothetical protein